MPRPTGSKWDPMGDQVADNGEVWARAQVEGVTDTGRAAAMSLPARSPMDT